MASANLRATALARFKFTLMKIRLNESAPPCQKRFKESPRITSALLRCMQPQEGWTCKKGKHVSSRFPFRSPRSLSGGKPPGQELSQPEARRKGPPSRYERAVGDCCGGAPTATPDRIN